MTRKLSIILAAAFVIGAVPGLVFAEPSGLGRIHSDESLYHARTWNSNPDWDQRNFGNETLVFNRETGQYEIHYGLSDVPRQDQVGVAQTGSENIRTEQRAFSSQQQVTAPSATSQSVVSPSYGPAGTGSVERYDIHSGSSSVRSGSDVSMGTPSAGAGASAGAGIGAAGMGSSYSDTGMSQSFGPSGTGSTDVRSQQVPSSAFPSQIDVNTSVKFHSGDPSGSASSSAPAAGSWSTSQRGVYNPSTGQYELSDSGQSYDASGTGAIAGQSDLNAGSSVSAGTHSDMSSSVGMGLGSDSGLGDYSDAELSSDHSLIAAQSPNTVEAYQWPPDAGFASSNFGPSGTGAIESGNTASSSSMTSESSSSWSSSGAVGTGALPAPSFRDAAPSMEDVDTGDAPMDDLDTFFNPQHPDHRAIDLGGGGE